MLFVTTRGRRKLFEHVSAYFWFYIQKLENSSSTGPTDLRSFNTTRLLFTIKQRVNIGLQFVTSQQGRIYRGGILPLKSYFLKELTAKILL